MKVEEEDGPVVPDRAFTVYVPAVRFGNVQVKVKLPVCDPACNTVWGMPCHDKVTDRFVGQLIP